MLDANGAALGEINYDSFGKIAAGSTTPAAAGSLFGYAGSVYDATTGLDYMNARYYDPASGRFLSEDPIDADPNPYRYVGNNPINLVDPTGLSAQTSYLGGGNSYSDDIYDIYNGPLASVYNAPQSYASPPGAINGLGSSYGNSFYGDPSGLSPWDFNSWGTLPGTISPLDPFYADDLGARPGPGIIGSAMGDNTRNYITSNYRPDAAMDILANPRVQGGLQMVGGIASGAAAIGLAGVPEATFTKVGAAALGLNAADNLQAGWRQLSSGEFTPTVTQQTVAAGLTKVGVSPATANTAGGLTNAGIQVFGTMGAGTYTSFARAASGAGAVATNAAPNSARSIISGIAQEQADLGPLGLRRFMSQNQWNAYAKDPAAGSRFLGTAVHNATTQTLREAFGTRFHYQRIGPDFLDTMTGDLIELTTPGQVGAHIARGGAYNGARYSTYKLPQ